MHQSDLSAQHTTDGITSLANAQLDNYRRQPEELVSHFNRERAALDGYRGRQLLELLQNADDAGVGTTQSCALRFDLSRRRLLIANTGIPFSLKGITSLVISDCSPKQLDRTRFIGNKGLGFRSILSWTDRPMIFSGTYEVAFDRDRAIAAVQSLAAASPAISDSVASFENATGRWPVAIMRFPFGPCDIDSWTAEARLWRDAFDTVIVVPLPDGERGDAVHAEITKQLSLLSSTSLLFCRNLTLLEITGDLDRHWSLLRQENELTGRSTVVVKCADAPEEFWQVARSHGEVSVEAATASNVHSREFQVGIAIPENVRPNPDGTLCVYFPTHERLPCALVLHATVETTDDRNRLLNHNSNREVLKHLAKEIAIVLEEEARGHEPTRALKLLAGVERADPELIDLGFRDELVAACESRKLFSRMDGAVATAAECSLVPHNVWLNELSPTPFPELSPIRTDDAARPLIRLFGLAWLTKERIRKGLQDHLVTLPRRKAGEIVGKLLAANQFTQITAQGLLIDEHGALVAQGSCFLNPDEKLPPLPSWVSDIRFVDVAFQEGLLLGSKTHSVKDLLTDLTRAKANIEEYRFETVSRALIDRADGDSPDDTARIDRWRHLLRWLSLASTNSKSVLPHLSIQVVTTRGTLRRATDCYLGDAYPRGRLLWRLYNTFGEDEFAAAPDVCGLDNMPRHAAERFMIAIGVNAAPRLVPFSNGTQYDHFRQMIIDRLSFPLSVRGKLCNSPADVRSWCWYITISGLRLPDRWFALMADADRVAFTAYLLSIGAPLLVSEIAADAHFLSCINSERKAWLDSSILIPNPILYFLRNTAWISAGDDTRHKPSEIMLGGQGARLLQGIYARHAIDTGDPLLASLGGRDAVDAMLTRLGAVVSLETLRGQSLYDLLRSLPIKDPKGDIAPGIYRTLIESSATSEESPFRAEFLKTGRLWGRHKGTEDYFPLATLRYNANVAITKAIEDHIPLVSIPRRMNTGVIGQLFGVVPLTAADISLQLVSDGTEYDQGSEEANQHLQTALPYIYALRLSRNLDDRGRVLGLLRKATLRVCSRILISAVLPGGRREEVSLAQPGDRIVVDTALMIVGEYHDAARSSLTFWLSVAELVAELFGNDIADEIGGILRCRTTAEMDEVVNVRLVGDAVTKLSEARTRLEESNTQSDRPSPRVRPLPAPVPPNQSPPEVVEDGEAAPSIPPTSNDAATSGADIPTSGESPRPQEFVPITGPENTPPKRRRLIVTGAGESSGGGRGPLATEAVTFAIAQAFELLEGRFVVAVAHLRGAEAFGCDLLSVASATIREAAISSQSINESDILRYIEVKGRSVRSGLVELTDNEYLAAKKHGPRYWLYRVFVDPTGSSHFEVALLNNPVNSSAKLMVPRFDLAEGSGANWFRMMDTIVDDDSNDVS